MSSHVGRSFSDDIDGSADTASIFPRINVVHLHKREAKVVEEWIISVSILLVAYSPFPLLVSFRPVMGNYRQIL